ncbi:MAG: hypothetical protein HY865_22655 [Chloroflexi bacterium]|nr:hypothetical protein [Chloroflexota bacterium]
MKKKYAIEDAAERLLKELSRGVSAFRKMIFGKPKDKMERRYNLINTAMWMCFVLGLLYIRTL